MSCAMRWRAAARLAAAADAAARHIDNFGETRAERHSTCLTRGIATRARRHAWCGRAALPPTAAAVGGESASGTQDSRLRTRRTRVFDRSKSCAGAPQRVRPLPRRRDTWTAAARHARRAISGHAASLLYIPAHASRALFNKRSVSTCKSTPASSIAAVN